MIEEAVEAGFKAINQGAYLTLLIFILITALIYMAWRDEKRHIETVEVIKNNTLAMGKMIEIGNYCQIKRVQR